MSIEQDIRQVNFRNDHHKAIINIVYTYNWTMERQKALFDTEKITPQQFNILRILRGAQPHPISTLQIRERMLDKMSDTSRIVDRLVIKGLANKKTNLNDKRLVDISITNAGLDLLKRLDIKNDEMDAILGKLNGGEVKTLNILLDKIRSAD